MPLLRFFDAGRAEAFSKTVVEEYLKIHVLVDSSKKHAGRKETRTIALIQKISAFAATEKLNFYVRAKMLAGIKSGLKDAGIEDGEIQAFIRAVVMEALRTPRKSGGK